MQITWQWTGWLGVIAAVIVAVCGFHYQVKRTPSASDPELRRFSAFVILITLAAITLGTQGFLGQIIPVVFLTATVIIMVAGLLLSVIAAMSWDDMSIVRLALVAAAALFSLGGTGIYNVVSLSPDSGAISDERTASLENARKQIATSMEATNEAIRAMRQAQIEVENLQKTVSDLQKQQDEISARLVSQPAPNNDAHGDMVEALWAIIGMLLAFYLAWQLSHGFDVFYWSRNVEVKK